MTPDAADSVGPTSTRLIGLSADRTTVTLLATRLGHADDLDGMVIEVADHHGARIGQYPIGPWRQTPVRSSPKRDHHHLHWVKPTIEGLEPGTRYRVDLIDRRGLPRATAQVTTTPGPTETTVRLAAGSCFDVNGRHRSVLGRAYDQLADGADESVPTYNLWLGDQVYVDAPWLETTTTAKMRSVIFDRYLRTWGLKRSDGDPTGDDPGPVAGRGSSDLHGAMARTSNWFLPDDHEFWNGYPNPSWLTLFGHTAVRFLRQIWRLPRPAPPHPAAQGRWGTTAGEAYALFASPLDFARFGEDQSPEQLQTFATDQMVLAMVDTRWHRTIRKQGPGAGFMARPDFERLLTLLRDDERLVCLGLSKPIIGHLPHRGLTRRKVEYGPEDYPGQYKALWQALTERRQQGRPTLILAGDVHHHAIRGALGDGLLEVTSSPLSMLAALDDDSELTRLRETWVGVRGRLQGAWRSAKGWIRGREEAVRRIGEVDDDTAYPHFGDDGQWEPASGTKPFEANPLDFVDEHNRDGLEPSGLATVEVHSDAGGHTVTVNYVLGYVDHRGDVVTHREDRTFRWDATDLGDPTTQPAWRKQ